MPSLRTTLESVSERLARYAGKRRINEQNTKATLIEPVLRALGWDLEDLDEVQREFRPKRRDNPVDYALFELRSPRLFLEAKAVGEDLNDRKWAGQIFSYAAVAGVEWVVLTNGREYRIYNAHAPVDAEEKLFRTVDVAEDPGAAHDTLKLLSKEAMAGNRLEALWRAHFVDRQVRAALESAFAEDPDPALVRLLSKRIPSLGASDVRASLTRLRIDLEFPLDTVGDGEPSSASKRSEKAPRRRKARASSRKAPTARSSTSVADLISAGLLSQGARLEKVYRGVTLEATVLSDGSIDYGGQAFTSPSSAGAAARAKVQGLSPSEKPPATNGWAFWSCTDADGQTVLLQVLRDRLDEGGGPRLRIVRGGA